MPLLPEQQARERIDAMLLAAGWAVQSRDAVNLHAAKGVAVREFHLLPGHGIADYLLFVDGKAVGVIEAKKEGETLSGVEIQTEQYSVGLPPKYPAPVRPLPFLFQSTGVETWFTNRLDTEPRARRVFHLLRADAFAASIAQSKRRAQRLRRAILAAAFQGRLVPQDPNDEPASVLLDRIRAQAATSEVATAVAPRRGRPPAPARAAEPVAAYAAQAPKHRGRPPGSKNKAKP